jgi:hypothetical protein
MWAVFTLKPDTHCHVERGSNAGARQRGWRQGKPWSLPKHRLALFRFFYRLTLKPKPKLTITHLK